MHNILLHSQAFGHSKTDIQLRICTLFRLIYYSLFYAISTLNFTRNGLNKESRAKRAKSENSVTNLRVLFFRFCTTYFLQFYYSTIKKIWIETIIPFTVFSIPLFYNSIL